MMYIYSLILLFFLSCSCLCKAEKIWIQDYDVIWNEPSKNAAESMPLGGGDLGCNVWVENGDILIYAQKSGSFSENGEYLKLGRFRVQLSPNPFKNAEDFEQRLVLKDGSIWS